MTLQLLKDVFIWAILFPGLDVLTAILTKKMFKIPSLYSPTVNVLLLEALHEKCPNTEFFLVRIFPYSDQEKPSIGTLFTQYGVQGTQIFLLKLLTFQRCWLGAREVSWVVRFVLRNILKSLQKRKLKTETFFCCSNKITLCTIPLGEFNQSCFSRKIHSLMQRKTALCLYLHEEMNKSITHRKYGLYSI